MFVLILTLFVLALPSIDAQASCNPLSTQKCPTIKGLPTSTFSVDFTQQTSVPPGWVLDNWANVTFTKDGAKYFFEKQGNAPYMWTDFYVAYGRIDVELIIAKGAGIVTSSVMFSDTQDEIDWEFSGSNFAHSSGKAFTNYFGKGVTGNYDRGTLEDVESPQALPHTYSFDWTPNQLVWMIDGKAVRTMPNNGEATGPHQFPQTPSRLHVGIWDAGSPSTAEGTVWWAGGYTNYSQMPFWATMKSMKIITYFPCQTWEYPENFSGLWKDVKCINATKSSSSSIATTVSALTTTSGSITTSPKVSTTTGNNNVSSASSTSTSTLSRSASTTSSVPTISSTVTTPSSSKTTTTASSTVSATSSTKTTTAASSTITTPTTTSSSSKKDTSSLSLTSSSSSSPSSSSPSSSTSKPKPTTIPPDWIYKGCYTDPATFFWRTLPVWSGVPWLEVNSTRCVIACDSQGYKYAGTEYSWECWCGNSPSVGFSSFSVSQRPESECNMKCVNNEDEICGGGFRLSLFAKREFPPDNTTSSSSTTSSSFSPSSIHASTSTTMTKKSKKSMIPTSQEKKKRRKADLSGGLGRRRYAHDHDHDHDRDHNHGRAYNNHE